MHPPSSRVFKLQILHLHHHALRQKGAAEVLEKLAVVERELCKEFKSSCLKTFEAKRFDKVKSVRETMNQMIEAWNAIPDVAEGVSPKGGVLVLSMFDPTTSVV
ncbi:tortifolia1-like protein 4 [Tanacetum coccineum]